MNLRPLKELSNQQNRIALGSTKYFTFSGERNISPPFLLCMVRNFQKKNRRQNKKILSQHSFELRIQETTHRSYGAWQGKRQGEFGSQQCAPWDSWDLAPSCWGWSKKPVKQKDGHLYWILLLHVGVSKNGKTPKMDGENNGNPY